MIKRIQIENYKSFGKVDIEPHPRVNLLIGPNSSGKSNFLEALQFGKVNKDPIANLPSYCKAFKSRFNKKLKPEFVSIELEISIPEIKETNLRITVDNLKVQCELWPVPGKPEGSIELLTWLDFEQAIDVKGTSNQSGSSKLRETFFHFLDNRVQQFQASVSSARKEVLSQKFQSLDPDLGNIALLIRHLDDYHRDGLFQQFRNALKELTYEFDLVTAPPSSSPGHIELCFFSNGVSYSPNEVSDGILLFTALLAILHLPEPPQVILLEEPENGIHPRRLAEIVSLIRRLAEEKEVQFFITTHSPIILDQFQDAPECVLVFDKVDGVSKVRNLSAILEEKAAIEKANGLPITDYTKGLSDNWLWGYLDGVPPITI